MPFTPLLSAPARRLGFVLAGLGLFLLPGDRLLSGDLGWEIGSAAFAIGVPLALRRRVVADVPEAVILRALAEGGHDESCPAVELLDDRCAYRGNAACTCWKRDLRALLDEPKPTSRRPHLWRRFLTPRETRPGRG